MRFSDIREQCLRDLGYHFSNPETQFGPSVNNRINAAYQGLSAKANWAWWMDRLIVPVAPTWTRLSLPFRFASLFQVRDSLGRLIPGNPLSSHLAYQEWEEASGGYRVALGPSSPRTYFSNGTITLATGATQATLSGSIFPADVAGRVLAFPGDDEEFIITERVDDTTVNLHAARVGGNLSDAAFTIDRTFTRSLILRWPGNEAETWHLWYFWTPPRLVMDDDEPLLPEEFHYYLVAAPRDQLLQQQRERQALTQMAKLESELILDDMRQRNATLLMDMSQEIVAYA